MAPLVPSQGHGLRHAKFQSDYEAEAFASGSALRGSRLLRRGGSAQDLAPESGHAGPGLRAEAARLRARLDAARAEVAQSTWDAGAKVVPAAPSFVQYDAGNAVSQLRVPAYLSAPEAEAAPKKRADMADPEVLNLRSQLESSREENAQLQGQLVTSQAEIAALGKRLQAEVAGGFSRGETTIIPLEAFAGTLAKSPPRVPGNLAMTAWGRATQEDFWQDSRLPARREVEELQMKLQDTAAAWAQATARNAELQNQLKAHQSSSQDLDFIQQVAVHNERRNAELYEQLAEKRQEVSALKEKLRGLEHRLEFSLAAPQQTLSNISRELERQEEAAQSHERRSLDLAEQLAAKRQEVAMLKDDLQSKSGELKRALADKELAAHRTLIDRDEARSNARAAEAKHRELAAQLASQQEQRVEVAEVEARSAVQVAELQASLARQRDASGASARMLQAAQIDCEELRNAMAEQEEAGDFRASMLQTRVMDLQMQHQDMVNAWSVAGSQATQLQRELDRQHESAFHTMEEQALQLQASQATNVDLNRRLIEQQEELEQRTSRVVELQSKLALQEQLSEDSRSRLRSESMADVRSLEEQVADRVKTAEAAAQEAWTTGEEEARSLSEQLELAEQLAESHERRNSELAEQVSSRRKELASLKARVVAKATEHEQAMSQQEDEAHEAAEEAAELLGRAEASASQQKQELDNLRSQIDWQQHEQREAETRLQEHLLQATQMQALAQMRAQAEADAAARANTEVQMLKIRLDEHRAEACSVAQLRQELGSAEDKLQEAGRLEMRQEEVLRKATAEHAQRLESSKASARSLQEELLAAQSASQRETTTTEAELRDAADKLQSARSQHELAESRLAATSSRHEAVTAELVTVSSRLEAMEQRGQHLEDTLASRLQQLDPSIGHDLRSVSVHHLSTSLLDGVVMSGLSLDAKMSEVEQKVLKPHGHDVQCPTDGVAGASYSDSVYGPDDAGLATHILSFCDEDAVGEVVGALEWHCQEQGLNPKRTYVWACSLCINLHRVRADPGTEMKQFRNRVRSVGKVLVVMSPWRKPSCLKQLRSLTELWEALQQSPQHPQSPPRRSWRDGWARSSPTPYFEVAGASDGACEVTMLLPPRAAGKLRQELRDNDESCALAWRGLQERWLEAAEAEALERDQLVDFIGSGLVEANRFLTRRLQRWLAMNLERQLRLMITTSELSAGESAARMFDAVGWMLWESGMNDHAGELLQDGLQLSLEGAFPAAAGRAAAQSRLEVNKAMTNLEVFQLAGSIFEKAGEQDTPSIATLLTHMGVARGDAQDHHGALEAFVHAKRIRKATNTLESVAGAVLLWNLGYTFEKVSESENAAKAYEEAEAVRRVTGTLDTPGGARLQKAQRSLAQGKLNTGIVASP